MTATQELLARINALGPRLVVDRGPGGLLVRFAGLMEAFEQVGAARRPLEMAFASEPQLQGFLKRFLAASERLG